MCVNIIDEVTFGRSAVDTLKSWTFFVQMLDLRNTRSPSGISYALRFGSSINIFALHDLAQML